jgi:hypothetical protein
MENREGQRQYMQIHKVIKAGQSKMRKPQEDMSWLRDARDLDRQKGAI